MYEIPDGFLNEEVRDGFKVSSRMKSAWAAELKTLDAIMTFCREHQITCFAAFGTLLGAARHKGFIPWDDDIDLAMPRADYMRFLSLASELPYPYRVKSIYTEDVFTQFHTVVSNSREEKLTWDEQRINEFFGCPFLIGIDIFALDYIPKEQGRQDLQRLMYTMGYGLTGQMDGLFENPYTLTIGEIEANPEAVLKRDSDKSKAAESAQGEIFVKIVKGLEDFIKTLMAFGKYLNMDFDKESSLFMQLMKLTDRIAASCDRENAGYMTFAHSFAQMGKNSASLFRNIEWYESTVNLPFENIMVTVPSGYQEILKLQYGDWHQMIKGGTSHDYPFYKSQVEYFKFLGKM